MEGVTIIRQECTSESALLSIAQMNAENVVRALTEPVMDSICKDYTLIVLSETAEAAESEEGSVESAS